MLFSNITESLSSSMPYSLNISLLVLSLLFNISTISLFSISGYFSKTLSIIPAIFWLKLYVYVLYCLYIKIENVIRNIIITIKGIGYRIDSEVD